MTDQLQMDLNGHAPAPLPERRSFMALAEQPGGTRCPTCGQHAQVYRRKVNSGMARSLIAMHRAAGPGEWIHVPTVLDARSREEGKLAYWHLVEEAAEPRDDGGRAGWWRVTERGRLFVLGLIAVPRYLRVYDGRVLGPDTDELATIRDALGTRFSYDDLMAGR